MSSSSDEEYETVQKSGTRKRQIKVPKKTKKNKSRRQNSTTKNTSVKKSNGTSGNVNEGASTSHAQKQTEHETPTYEEKKGSNDDAQHSEEASASIAQDDGSAVAIPSPDPDTDHPTPSHEDEATAAPTPSQDPDVEQAGPSHQGGSAKERFNQRNQSVTPLRKCSELIPGRRYKVLNLARTNTQFGSAVRAFILDERSPTGKSFCYLPVRFRNLSDEDLAELNLQASTDDGLHIIYSGRVGKADMIELV